MVLRGLRNSRLKDYFDVHALLREGALETGVLADAIASTFDRRQTVVPTETPDGLTEKFTSEPVQQARWRAFLSKNRIEGPTLEVLVDAIRDGLAPALDQVRRNAGA